MMANRCRFETLIKPLPTAIWKVLVHSMIVVVTMVIEIITQIELGC
jgi:hypothetical protein